MSFVPNSVFSEDQKDKCKAKLSELDKSSDWLVEPSFQLNEVSPTLAIYEAAQAMRAEGKRVFAMGFGQSPFNPPARLMKGLDAVKELPDLGSKYPPGNGLPALREKISEFYRQLYKLEMAPELIRIFPGTKAGIFHALSVIQGDLLLPSPAWVSYEPQGKKILEKRVHWMKTTIEAGYKLEPKSFVESLEGVYSQMGISKKHQKIIIINSPNNPTGSVYSEAEVKALVPIMREHNILVIEDGIYAHPINYSGERVGFFVEHYPEGTIFSGGISKNFSAGGYRVGFLAFPNTMENLAQATSNLFSETLSAVSTVDQRIAIEAYSPEKDIRDYLHTTLRLHRAAALYFYNRLIKMGIEVAKPEGAFYLFPSFEPFKEKLKERFGVENSVQLSKVLLELHHITSVAGSAFGMPEGELNIRLAPVIYDGPNAYRMAQSAGEISENFVETHMPQLKEAADHIEDFLDGLK